MAVWEDLSEDEAYLFAILDDQSGIDQAEFLWFEGGNPDGCWRFWPFQWNWLRCTEKLQIGLSGRSVGKSMSIVARMFGFVMRAIGQEALITAPELIHLEPIANLIEERIQSVRLTRELLPKGRSAITHRPFMVNTKIGSRILGRIPQRDGKGVKGCLAEGTLVLTDKGYLPVEKLQVGDLVMTHRSRWRPIEEIQEDANDCYEVHGAGAFPTTVSCDHRFYGAENYDGTGELTEPGWHDVELMLEHRVHWATPLLFGSLPIPPFPEGFEDLQWSEKFWYGIGEHLAGGATSTDVDSWVAEHFGPPTRPIIPGWLLGATRHFRENVLAGFVGTPAAGPPDELSATAVDRALVLGMQMLAQSLGYRTVGISAGAESSVRLRRSDDDDGPVAFAPVGTLRPVGKARIFNPIVEEDHSYIAESVVSHNVHPLQLEQDECFPAGTLVLTKRGLVPIESVLIGDKVITHKNRYRKVTAKFTRVREVVETRGHGHPGLVSSVHHKFWGVREEKRLVPADDGVRTKRTWSLPDFVPICDLESGMWCSPTTFPKTQDISIPSFIGVGQRASSISVRCRPIDRTCPEFWWIVGLYLAEGSPYRDQVTFSIHKDETPEVMERLRAASFHPAGPYVVSHHGVECNGVNVVVNGIPEIAEWLGHHFGKGAKNKKIATWALGIPPQHRYELLSGLVYGDGFFDPDIRYAAGRWKLSTSSKALAISTRLLALSLGYSTSIYWNDLSERKPSIIRGREVKSAGFYQVVGNTSGQGFTYDNRRYTAVRHIAHLNREETLYDLTVEEDHSFIADGFIVANSQDYPNQGFKELNETLKTAVEGSEWRAHGVTKGVRGEFYRRTQPNSGWKVHKIQAMHRPTWTPEERELSLQKYGGHRDDPDFRRNVYGEHGDQTAALFVMSRLAKCIDDNKDSPYNTLEYQHVEISDAMIAEAREQGRDVADLLVLPESHRDYTKSGAKTWGGMDVGLTVDPSEILVFAEYEMSAEERKESQKVDRNTQNSKKACPKAGSTRLKLLLRLSLKRVTNPDQIKFILAVIDFYQLERFSLDRTGIGFPLWQDLQNLFREAEDMVGQVSDPQDKEKFRARAAVLREAAKRIKGYNFSEKVIVDIDDTVVVDEVDGDPIEDAAMRRTVLEHSTDLIRRMVDEERLWLPWDVTLIAEYEGQTISFSNSPIDQYGKRRRVFAEGKFHAFDASRMFAMGIGQQKIEALVEKPKEQESVFVQFG